MHGKLKKAKVSFVIFTSAVTNLIISPNGAHEHSLHAVCSEYDCQSKTLTEKTTGIELKLISNPFSMSFSDTMQKLPVIYVCRNSPSRKSKNLSE